MGRGDDVGLAPVPGAEELHAPAPPGSEAAHAEETRSLLADLETLIEDGRTYLEAETNYQKTRALYIADRLRTAALFGAVAGALGFIALIGLTVGLIMALAPYLTTWGSSALVVGVEFLLAIYFARRAQQGWNGIMGALGKDDGE